MLQLPNFWEKLKSMKAKINVYYSDLIDIKSIISIDPEIIVYFILVPENLQNLKYYFKEEKAEALMTKLDTFLYKRLIDKMRGQRNPFYYYEKNVKHNTAIQDIIKTIETKGKPNDIYCILPFCQEGTTEFENFFKYYT